MFGWVVLVWVLARLVERILPLLIHFARGFDLGKFTLIIGMQTAR